MFGAIKNYIIVALVILLMGAVATGAWYKRQSEKHKKEADSRKDLADTAISLWKDNKGNNHEKNSVADITSKEVAKEVVKSDKNIKRFCIKPKNVAGIGETGSITKDSGNASVSIKIKGDSTKKDTFTTITAKSRWMELDVVLKNNKTASYKYIHYDTLFQFLTAERPHKFLFIRYGKKKYFMENIFADTNSKVTYSKNIKITKKED